MSKTIIILITSLFLLTNCSDKNDDKPIFSREQYEIVAFTQIARQYTHDKSLEDSLIFRLYSIYTIDSASVHALKNQFFQPGPGLEKRMNYLITVLDSLKKHDLLEQKPN